MFDVNYVLVKFVDCHATMEEQLCKLLLTLTEAVSIQNTEFQIQTGSQNLILYC